MRDIQRRFCTFQDDWNAFPDKVVIQLNDTHPVVVIPEMMRILLDEFCLPWDEAWNITRRSFGYTCHTLMPEALEKWPVAIFEHLLPRHLEIIYEINARFLDEVRQRFPGDEERVRRMSIIEEAPEKSVRMAFLASVACFSINGVAELHTELLKELVLHDFYEMYPERFSSKTNGVSPRRFMRLANPRLSRLIDSKIGKDWTNHLERLHDLEPYASDPAFQQEWREVKRQNKVDLAALILTQTGVKVDPDSMFDVMVKRLHEYKRQLLKALHIITLYQRLKSGKTEAAVPRTVIFGAKAAPGYKQAKLIIKLINDIAATVNRDPETRDLLKVVFLPNFNVTLGEKIYPAAELSEQISLAGYEASGTGNMKFALNGALTIGTLDGANIEIRERVGAKNFFLFGMTADEVLARRTKGYRPMDAYLRNAELKSAVDALAAGVFSPDDSARFQPIVDMLLHNDAYLHMADYASFIAAQEAVDRLYRTPAEWTRKAILNCARSGFFSSDRAVQQYSDDIWKIGPVSFD
jgi:starch phosphorylase